MPQPLSSGFPSLMHCKRSHSFHSLGTLYGSCRYLMPCAPWLQNPEGSSVNAGLKDAELERESSPGARASLQGPSLTHMDLRLRSREDSGLSLARAPIRVFSFRDPELYTIHHRPSIIPSSGILLPALALHTGHLLHQHQLRALSLMGAVARASSIAPDTTLSFLWATLVTERL